MPLALHIICHGQRGDLAEVKAYTAGQDTIALTANAFG